MKDVNIPTKVIDVHRIAVTIFLTIFLTILFTGFLPLKQTTALAVDIDLGAEDEDVCEVISKIQRRQSSFYARLKMFKDIFLLKYYPKYYSRPKFHRVETDLKSDLFQKAPLNSWRDYRNIIFSLSPYPEEVVQYQDKDKEQRRKIIEEKLSTETAKLKRMLMAGSTLSCQEIQRELEFDLEYFYDLLNEKNELFRTGDQIRNGQMADKILNRIQKRLNLKWEIVYTTSIEDVFQALSQKDVANIIIISHGMSNGWIVDSSFNSYPQNFFYHISPTLLSVSFYSCYSGEIVTRYQLEKFMSKAPTIHKRRYAISVKKSKNSNYGKLAPLKSLGSFLNSVDYFLYKKLKYYTSYNKKYASAELLMPTSNCQLSTDDLSVVKGTFGFILNNYYIGSSGQYRNQNKITFPCTLLNVNVDANNSISNVLVLRNLNLYTWSQLLSPNFKIYGQYRDDYGEGNLQVKLVDHYFRREDNSYRSSKYYIFR